MVTTGSATGALVLVGTPIGNLADLTTRGIEALATADVIACEDTRRTGRLLSHLGVAAPKLVVANEHTEAEAATEIVARIASGERVALVTDAGMPGISDPGEVIVAAVIDAAQTLEVVPGPSALDTALVISGLPTGRFCFEGFLPRKGPARRARLNSVATDVRTSVLYEAPHRLTRTLRDLRDVCGNDRRLAVVRELTKLHEEHWRGDLATACELWDEREPRGEYVLVVAGAEPSPDPDDADLLAALGVHRDAGASTRDAVDAVAASFGVARRRVYRLAIDTT